MKKLYCGGAFPFDYRKNGFTELVRNDYRSRILGDVNLLLQPSNGQALREDLTYIGPFYFEAPEMVDTDIVLAEMKMVESCTHAIFLLDDGTCPGTITELTFASLLGKQIAVFYVRRHDSEETESPLHSPCWYPIRFSQAQNPNALVFSCRDREEASQLILEYLDTL